MTGFQLRIAYTGSRETKEVPQASKQVQAGPQSRWSKQVMASGAHSREEDTLAEQGVNFGQ